MHHSLVLYILGHYLLLVLFNMRFNFVPSPKKKPEFENFYCMQNCSLIIRLLNYEPYCASITLIPGESKSSPAVGENQSPRWILQYKTLIFHNLIPLKISILLLLCVLPQLTPGKSLGWDSTLRVGKWRIGFKGNANPSFPIWCQDGKKGKIILQ